MIKPTHTVFTGVAVLGPHRLLLEIKGREHSTVLTITAICNNGIIYLIGGHTTMVYLSFNWLQYLEKTVSTTA